MGVTYLRRNVATPSPTPVHGLWAQFNDEIAPLQAGLAYKVDIPFGHGWSIKSWTVTVDVGAATIELWVASGREPTEADSINVAGLSSPAENNTDLRDFTALNIPVGARVAMVIKAVSGGAKTVYFACEVG